MLCKGASGAPSFFQVALSSKIQNGATTSTTAKLSLLCQLPISEGGWIVRMPLRLIPASLIFICALPWIACKKTQPPVQSSVGAPARALPGTLAAAPQSAGKIETTGAGKGIRGVDLEKFLSTHYGEVNAELDLETACGEGQKPIQSVAPAIYGDLDGDGQEEAAFVAFTCLSGSGGADLFGVLKMMPDGKLAALPIEPMPKVFKGKNTYEALRGHMNLEIKDGRLVETYPIYEGGEANCCPEGGQRRFIYRWDGHQFVHDDMIDVPAAKGEQ
jgi:hypothetical protein